MSAQIGITMIATTTMMGVDEEETAAWAAGPEDVLGASAILFLVGLLGLTCNFVGMAVVRCNPLLNNAFGVLCFSQCVANTGVLVVFFCWCGPTTYFRSSPEATEGRLGKALGQLNIFFWDACVYSHIAISSNRLLCIAFPAKAGKMMTSVRTKFVVGAIWSLGVAHIIPYFWYEQCYIVYDAIAWTWNYAQTPCGNVISTYTDYMTGVSVFCVMVVMDLTTLCLLVFHRRHMSSIVGVQKRRRMEIRFFIQSCIQGSLFFYELFNFYYVSLLFNHRWFVFFTTTFAWEICHAVDGLVVCVFHFKKAVFLGPPRKVMMVQSSHSRHPQTSATHTNF